MAAFFLDVLDEFLSFGFLEEVRKKFHYGKTLAAEFQAVAEEMLPLMRKESFWERKNNFIKNRHQAENSNVIYENVVMSLGNGIDFLQENYSNKGMLSQSYMVEVLSSELLMRGYEAYNRYIRENTDWHVARYYFPGSEEEYPIEELPNLLYDITSKIICNYAFYLIPKKSVVFIAELTKDERVQCKGICVGCNNIHCSNRIEDNCQIRKKITEMTDMPLPYGYSRIFGINR